MTSTELADTPGQPQPLQQQVMSVMTLTELTFGVQDSAAAKRKRNLAVLDNLALHLAVLDWPREAAQHWADIRLDLEKLGAQLGAADLMIAGPCQSKSGCVESAPWRRTHRRRTARGRAEWQRHIGS